MKRLAAVAMLLVPSGLLPATSAEAGIVCMSECRCGGGQQSDLVVTVGGVSVCAEEISRLTSS